MNGVGMVSVEKQIQGMVDSKTKAWHARDAEALVLAVLANISAARASTASFGMREDTDLRAGS